MLKVNKSLMRPVGRAIADYAMIRNEEETYAHKRKVMQAVGITVVERPDAVFAQTAKVLGL